jgi:hypothetical protein
MAKKNLNRLKEKVNEFKLKQLVSLNIIHGGRHSFSEDGINIIALSHLYLN